MKTKRKDDHESNKVIKEKKRKERKEVGEREREIIR